MKGPVGSILSILLFCLTGNFAIFNSEIDKLYAVQKRRSTDLKALELRIDRSGVG